MGALDSENDSVYDGQYGFVATCCAASSQPFSGADCRSKMGAKSISMEKSDFFNLISGSVLFLSFWWNCKKTGIVFDKRWLGIKWFFENLDKTRTRSDSGSSSFSESVRDQMFPNQICNLTGMTFWNWWCCWFCRISYTGLGIERSIESDQFGSIAAVRSQWISKLDVFCLRIRIGYVFSFKTHHRTRSSYQNWRNCLSSAAVLFCYSAQPLDPRPCWNCKNDMMYLHKCIGVAPDSFHRKRRGPLFGPILFG